jgi:hypothetical protein
MATRASTMTCIHHMSFRPRGKRTLGARKGAILRALGKGTVEVCIESSVVDVANGVVHLHILLESLATVESNTVSKKAQMKSRRLALLFRSVSTTRCGKYSRATVTFLELQVKRWVSKSYKVIGVLVAMRRGQAQRRSRASKTRDRRCERLGQHDGEVATRTERTASLIISVMR